MSLRKRTRGIWTVSLEFEPVTKFRSLHRDMRTAASASAKVGAFLGYHAAARGVRLSWRAWAWTYKATREYRPSRAGVVRNTALSECWRWVSTPRWARASS